MRGIKVECVNILNQFWNKSITLQELHEQMQELENKQIPLLENKRKAVGIEKAIQKGGDNYGTQDNAWRDVS